jgi:hypothetical protein
MEHLLQAKLQATTLSSIMGVSTILPNFDYAPMAHTTLRIGWDEV